MTYPVSTFHFPDLSSPSSSLSSSFSSGGMVDDMESMGNVPELLTPGPLLDVPNVADEADAAEEQVDLVSMTPNDHGQEEVEQEEQELELDQEKEPEKEELGKAQAGNVDREPQQKASIASIASVASSSLTEASSSEPQVALPVPVPIVPAASAIEAPAPAVVALAAAAAAAPEAKDVGHKKIHHSIDFATLLQKDAQVRGVVRELEEKISKLNEKIMALDQEKSVSIQELDQMEKQLLLKRTELNSCHSSEEEIKVIREEVELLDRQGDVMAKLYESRRTCQLIIRLSECRPNILKEYDFTRCALVDMFLQSGHGNDLRSLTLEAVAQNWESQPPTVYQDINQVKTDYERLEPIVLF